MSPPLTVAVVDDQALMRTGFAMIVDAEPDMTVVGEASNGADGVTLCRNRRPDVVLMDIRMPDGDGIEATRTLASDDSIDTKVLILTTFDLDEYVYDAVRAGASGFLLKDTPPEDLVAAIRVVAAGDALLAPSVTKQLLAAFVRQPEPSRRATAALDTLTDREREVLVNLASGRSADLGRDHNKDPRQPRAHEAGGPRPRASSGSCLRVRPGPTQPDLIRRGHRRGLRPLSAGAARRNHSLRGPFAPRRRLGIRTGCRPLGPLTTRFCQRNRAVFRTTTLAERRSRRKMGRGPGGFAQALILME